MWSNDDAKIIVKIAACSLFAANIW